MNIEDEPVCSLCGVDTDIQPHANNCAKSQVTSPAMNAASQADLIAMIVDRDTPPDHRNEVIDHDVRGNPITRGDVESFAAPVGQGSAIGALVNIRDCAYFDASPSGDAYYRKAENALAAIECRDAKEKPRADQGSATSGEAAAHFKAWAATDDGNCNRIDLREYSVDSYERRTDGVTFISPLVERDWTVWQAASLAALAAKAEQANTPVPRMGGHDEALNALLDRIDDAAESYERHGAICQFEGNPMLYAVTLEEIVTLRGEYHVAQLAAPVAERAAAPASVQEEPGQWVACTPGLILAGIDCGKTPRRWSEERGNHEHFIAHTAAPEVAQPAAQGITEQADERALTQNWLTYCTILRQAGKNPTDALGDAFEFAWDAALAQQPSPEAPATQQAGKGD